MADVTSPSSGVLIQDPYGVSKGEDWPSPFICGRRRGIVVGAKTQDRNEGNLSAFQH